MSQPFAPTLGEAALADFRDRLARTRFPDPELVDDWSQGYPLLDAIKLRDALLQHDFSTCLAEIEALGSYRVHVDDIDLHYLHVAGPQDSVPLLLIHGWPGGIIEFLDVARALSEYHTLVIPSLPGFGYSMAPRRLGWGVERMADQLAALMAQLGHETFVAQGGDWGAEIGSLIAQRHPDHCLGAHLNLVSARVPQAVRDAPSDAEAAQMQRLRDWGRYEMGYYRQQASRPQTLAYGLSDSPIAQATWIAEKFRAWTDPSMGTPFGGVAQSRVLDMICLYWFTNSSASSSRLYWESGYSSGRTTIDAPVACSLYPHEINAPSQRWAESRYSQIVRWHEAKRGGHFPAMEVPEDFVADVLGGVDALLSAH